MTLELDRDLDSYTDKYELLSQEWHAQSFYAKTNLQDENINNMLKFARFVAFEKSHGNFSILEEAKNEAEADSE